MNNYVNICLGQCSLESWESFLDGYLGYFLLAFIVADFNKMLALGLNSPRQMEGVK